MGVYLYAFAGSLILSFILTPLFKKIAIRYDILDKPTPLKNHTIPVPYLGGGAIFLAFFLSVLLWGIAKTGYSKELFSIILGGGIIVLLGLVDDIRKLSPWTKFFVQLIASLVLILNGMKLTIQVLPAFLNLTLTVLWVIGITNAFNIIDVMDGLSAGVAFIASGIFFIIALMTGNMAVGIMSASLCGATFGFLRYNFKPAQIFMGDMGSGFLGFIISAIAIQESYTTTNYIALFSPLLILAVPIYDTLLVIYMRIKKGRPVFKGSRDHFALRLVALGLNERKTVLVTYGISLILGIFALVIVRLKIEWAIVAYVFIIIALVLVGSRLSKAKVEGEGKDKLG